MRKDIGITQCDSTKTCVNIRCFWKLRDTYGYPVFWYPKCKEDCDRILGTLKLQQKGINFPEIFVTVGTNCLYINCPDFMEKKKGGENKVMAKSKSKGKKGKGKGTKKAGKKKKKATSCSG